MRRLLALSVMLGLAASVVGPASDAVAQNRPANHRRRPPAPHRPPEPPPAEPPPSIIAHAVPVELSPPPATPAPEPAPEPAPREWRYPGLDVSVGARVFTRSLSWDGDTMQSLRPYDLSAAPAVRLTAEVFPGALTDSRVARMFGAVFHFDTAFALTTVDARGRHYDTSTASLLAGVKVRAPFESERHELALLVAYRRQSFSVRGDGDAPVTGAPDLAYESLQLGVTSRWALSHRVAITVDAAYLAVLATGQLAELFPHVSTSGLDLGAGVAVGVAAGFELRAGVDFRAYFHSFNPADGDRYPLTGATDQQFAGSLAVAYRR